MYTNENEGRNKGKEALDRGEEGEMGKGKRGKEGISPGESKSRHKTFVAARVRYAMVAEISTEVTCPLERREELHLVELLRCKICTWVALVPPTERRRGRISLPLPLPLRRLRVPRMEPRRRVWSKTDVLTLESGWLNAWTGLLAKDEYKQQGARIQKNSHGDKLI
jgi:hypothetical protein